MTDEELKHLEALSEAATPGPWPVVEPDYNAVLYLDVANQKGATKADLEFITAARSALPAALAEIRRMRQAADKQIEAMQRMQASFRKTPSAESQAIVSVLSDLIRLAAELRAGDGQRSEVR